MSDDQYSNSDAGLEVQEARPKLKKQNMYKVVLLNDDYTPMFYNGFFLWIPRKQHK